MPTDTKSVKPTEEPRTEKNSTDRKILLADREVSKWQAKLLPYMLRMLTGLTLFFFLASCIQLYILHNQIIQTPALNIDSTFYALDNDQSQLTASEKLERARWKTLVALESNVLARRYHQAEVLLMSRIWTSYLGFVTGMILALVGATFILGKLQESKSDISAESKIWKVSISTASPGLLLTLLGTILMVTTMVSKSRIDVTDAQIYLPNWFNTLQLKETQNIGDPEPFGHNSSDGGDLVIPTEKESRDRANNSNTETGRKKQAQH